MSLFFVSFSLRLIHASRPLSLRSFAACVAGKYTDKIRQSSCVDCELGRYHDGLSYKTQTGYNIYMNQQIVRMDVSALENQQDRIVKIKAEWDAETDDVKLEFEDRAVDLADMVQMIHKKWCKNCPAGYYQVNISVCCCFCFCLIFFVFCVLYLLTISFSFLLKGRNCAKKL
jgi:hypothetical protein